MTHDLVIHLPEPLSAGEVQERVRASELGALVSEEHSLPELTVLLDPDTAVHATLAPGIPELTQEEVEAEVEAPPLLLFQIPYLRPDFFAEQGAAWAVAVAQLLGGTLEDVQEKARGVSAGDVRAAWDRGNRALRAELEQPTEEGMPPPDRPRPVPRAILRAAYDHNRSCRALREQAGPGVEVPRLVLAAIPARRDPALVCRFTAGETVLLPDAATHVVLERLKKSWLGGRREEILVEAPALREAVAAFTTAGPSPGVSRVDPGRPADDPLWQKLEGQPARGLAVMDWAGLVDE